MKYIITHFSGMETKRHLVTIIAGRLSLNNHFDDGKTSCLVPQVETQHWSPLQEHDMIGGWTSDYGSSLGS